MAELKVKSWESYEYKGALSAANAEDLRPIVRRAAKAANMRLLRLERKGYTKGIYQLAQKRLNEVGRRRFTERTDAMDIAQLRTEYARLRDFLSAKTSTVQGQKSTAFARYDTAVSRGFVGTYDDFVDKVTKLYTAEIESLYSSDTIYDMIISNDDEIMDEAIKRSHTTQSPNKGEELLRYLRKKKRK